VSLAAVILTVLSVAAPGMAQQTTGGSHSARPLISDGIDQGALVTLSNHVRHDLTPEKDAGLVEDSMPIRLFIVLKRSPEQQADLDAFVSEQQNPASPNYHKWLTPQQFGERFGAAASDISKITQWLESQGFQVKNVLNNGSMIDFQATAGGIRNTFHTEMHYWNVQGGKYVANAQNPQIPAALLNVVDGFTGLSKIPPPSKHTPIHPVAYDSETHTWHAADAVKTGESGGKAKYSDGQGNYFVSPRDFYTIYNVNPIYSGGNLGAGATISLPEPTDFKFGTPNATTGATTGGDVATFRSVFGVAGTLNMTVLHGPTAANPSCGDPGINGAEGEAVLDSEWANAVAPNAHLIFMSCSDAGGGFTGALTTLIDNNISDIISSSYGASEAVLTPGDVSLDTTLSSQAAAQGQSFLDAAGDAGAADADQNSPTVAIQGLNVDQFAGTPLVTAVGGTDFQDRYDADLGGTAQTTYWGANGTFYNDALGYIPETPWNNSCADSIIANDSVQNGIGTFAGAGLCGASTAANVNGTVIGGGGGYSVDYTQPSYQVGTPGLSSSATMRATPDIAFFAANGYWGHAILVCDSFPAGGGSACTSPSTFGSAGGTSFTAPQFAGVAALLITMTGERQGTLNPGIYALARKQFANSPSGCYSNGQTSNIGTTKSLPGTTCIFNDVTTGNNDEVCQSGGKSCYVNAGKTYGMLSASGSSSLTVAYPAGAYYDLATGLGSLNIANFINGWSGANSSSTALSANPTSISPSQSTTLKATVTGTPATGYTGTPPVVTGNVVFNLGSTSLGTCTLASGTCSLSVAATKLKSGANSITATYTSTGTYPSSTSSAVTVTVTSADTTPPTVTYTGESAGPPVEVFFSSQDNTGGSGLASVVVTKCTNCTSSTASFTVGTSSAVTTTATKTNQALSSSITLVATDVAGNATTLDPVDLRLESQGRPTEHRIQISSQESKVLISNGNPGMSWIKLVVNKIALPAIPLSNGEGLTLNIRMYLRPGRPNQVLITADGKDDATSLIVFTQP
jgi:subtilase family serine protease